MIKHALLAGLVSLGVSSLFAPIIFKMIKAMKSHQNVSEHLPQHAEKQGTPTMGGLIILLGAIVGAFAAPSVDLLAPLVLIATYGLVGFSDDYLVPKFKPGSRGLHWVPKLGLEIGGVLLAVWIAGLTQPYQIALAVFLVLMFGNAFNFADGLDGQAAGLGAFLILGLAGVMYGFGTYSASLTVLAAILAALIPFFILNAPPAKVFMGDVGALPIGAVLGWAVFDMVSLPEAADHGIWLWTALGVWSLVMLAEIVPPPLQVFSFKLRKKRLFPFKTPIHHGLQDSGWPETRVASLLVSLQAAVSLIAVAIAVAKGPL
jgi:phospho-N-acetylmuramoyl-pentapeptide-transferase